MVYHHLEGEFLDRARARCKPAISSILSFVTDHLEELRKVIAEIVELDLIMPSLRLLDDLVVFAIRSTKPSDSVFIFELQTARLLKRGSPLSRIDKLLKYLREVRYFS